MKNSIVLSSPTLESPLIFQRHIEKDRIFFKAQWREEVSVWKKQMPKADGVTWGKDGTCAQDLAIIRSWLILTDRCRQVGRTNASPWGLSGNGAWGHPDQRILVLHCFLGNQIHRRTGMSEDKQAGVTMGMCLFPSQYFGAWKKQNIVPLGRRPSA